MKRYIQVLIFVGVVTGAFLAGRWNAGGSGGAAEKQARTRKVLYYICPMHPQYRSDHPGNAPCCGMRLEPVYADGRAPQSSLPPGTVRISPEKQQLIGVRFATADLTSGTQTMRTVGRLAYDREEAVVIADLLEHQASRVEVGHRALVSVPFHSEQSFWAKVDYVYPRLDTTTRTLKVRLNGGQTGFNLLPDTFVNVEFHIPGPAALTVPAESVLNSGLRQVVFVDLGEGYLEPRQVETARRLGERIEIRKGLKRGERVAASGNFLIDSESRLELAAAGTATPPARPLEAAPNRDPVCGMEVDRAKAAGTSVYRGKTYDFCSRDCKTEFDRNPAGYVKTNEKAEPSPKREKPEQTKQEPIERPAPARSATAPGSQSPAVYKDPVCGKQVQQRNAYRRSVLYNEVTLYFCSDECFRTFMMNPEFYGQKAVPITVQKPRDLDVVTPDTAQPTQEPRHEPGTQP